MAGLYVFAGGLVAGIIALIVHSKITDPGTNPNDRVSDTVAIASTSIVMLAWLLFVLIASLFATKLLKIDARVALPISLLVGLLLGWPLIGMLAFVNSCNTKTTFPFSFDSAC